MTAQGEDLLAWLDSAISARERTAQDSVAQASVHLAGADPSFVGVWHVVERPATGTFVATRDQWDRVAEVVPTYGGAHAEHIALNHPASVLRRCAADRKLLAIHNVPSVVTPGFGTREDDRRCVGCGFGSDEEPRVDDVDDCPVLNALAEGYGRSEQTPPIEGDQVT